MNLNSVSLIWEIPLAFASFCFYKIMKFIFGNLYIIFLTFNRKKAYQWRIFSEKLINSFLSLPVIMTKAPRWNTHAIIGILGPIQVKQSLTINRQIADNSAKSWFIVIYSFPRYQTITTIESTSTNSQNWLSLNLAPGFYTLGMRYYEGYEQITFPEIKIDNTAIIASETVASNINNYYQNLENKTNWFYSALHYYIYTILRLQKWLPKSWVKYEFLPVGAPDTAFIYDYLQKGEILSIEIASLVFDEYYIYLTTYNRASLPVKSFKIHQNNLTLDAAKTDSFYLFRLRYKQAKNKTHNITSFSERNDSNQVKLSIQMKEFFML